MEKIIRVGELSRLLGLSRTTIWRLESQGTFPRHIMLSKRGIGWKLSDINEWLASR